MNSSNALPMKVIERIFMRLHGRFGNAFYEKYRVGKLNQSGEDVGIENAKITWSEELAGMSLERLKTALSASYDYPPSCDEFRKNCISKPVIDDFTALPAPADYESSKAQSHKLNELAKEITKPRTDYLLWAKKIIQRFKDGDKSVNDHALKLAREALGITA